jgi:hypothetical protein
MERGVFSNASVRLYDLVGSLLVANNLTDAVKIALDSATGDDEGGFETFEFSSPTGQLTIVRRARKEVALLKNLVAVRIDIGAEPVDFHSFRCRIR